MTLAHRGSHHTDLSLHLDLYSLSDQQREHSRSLQALSASYPSHAKAVMQVEAFFALEKERDVVSRRSTGNVVILQMNSFPRAMHI